MILKWELLNRDRYQKVIGRLHFQLLKNVTERILCEHRSNLMFKSQTNDYQREKFA